MQDIEGWKGLYAVTKDGRIWSHPKKWARGYHNGKWLKQSFTFDGYPYVILSKNKTNKILKVHRIVAQTYIPNPLNLPQVNHKNGVKIDNSVENLEWMTNLENARHAWETGLQKPHHGQVGEKHSAVKLNDKKVIQIRKMYKTGKYSQLELGNKFKVGSGNIHAITSGKTWTHLL